MVWNRWSRILQFVSIPIPESWAWEIATGKIMNGGKIFLCQSCPFTVRWSKNQSSLTQILFQSECFELSFKIFIIKKTVIIPQSLKIQKSYQLELSCLIIKNCQNLLVFLCFYFKMELLKVVIERRSPTLVDYPKKTNGIMDS